MKFLLLSFVIISFASNGLFGQKVSDEYWAALDVAMDHYDNEDYLNASKAFEVLWTKPNGKEMANHRLYAAASNCMIDNEIGVKENLFKIVDVASKRDMKRILVNYEIFNRYKDKKWWLELETDLDARLASLIAHHQNLNIFKKGRNFKYSAIRINGKGDTLANTFVTLLPGGTGWGDEAATSQSQVVYKYDYTEKDSLDHIAELDSISHVRFWNGLDTTGVIENDSFVWIHPIRNNEFFKTEIAPFPSVKLPISENCMKGFNPKTIIMANWGSYTNTETYENYTYIEEVKRSYNFDSSLSCHKFKGEADNTRHGISKIEYYFNEDYGFVEMNYETYDGDVIEFKIIDIVE